MMLLRSMFLSTQDRLKTPFSSIFRCLEVPNLGAIRAQKDKPHEQALRTLHGYGSSSQGRPLPSKGFKRSFHGAFEGLLCQAG